jgi:two-component system chemotaxis response regulator CheB
VVLTEISMTEPPGSMPKNLRGIAIVQDTKEAVSAMPQSALRNVSVNHCLPLAKMGALLVRLASTRARAV